MAKKLFNISIGSEITPSLKKQRIQKTIFIKNKAPCIGQNQKINNKRQGEKKKKKIFSISVFSAQYNK